MEFHANHEFLQQQKQQSDEWSHVWTTVNYILPLNV